MQLPLSLLAGLESLINPLLRQAALQEGRSAQALQDLQGSWLELRVTGWDLQVFVLLDAQGLSLYRQTEQPVDAWMAADASTYLKMATRPDAAALLFSPAVSIGGDTHKLELLQELLSALGLDAADLVSRVTGPLPVAALHSGLGQLLGFARRFSQSARQDLRDYLEEESGVLPGRNSLHLLEDGLDELRLDVDRLEARIRLLEQQASSPAGDH